MTALAATVLALGWVAGIPVFAGEREEALRELMALGEPGGLRLELAVEDGLTLAAYDGNGLRIGDGYQLRIGSDRAGSLLVVALDTHGVATVLAPTRGQPQLRVTPGRIATFPLNNVLRVRPPVGTIDLVVLQTAQRVDWARLGPNPTQSQIIVDSPDTLAWSQRLAGLLAGSGRVQRAALRLTVRGRAPVRGSSDVVTRGGVTRGGGAEYTATDVIEYFTGTRARAVKRARLDLHIRFQTDSDRLDAVARSNLDAMATALEHPALAARRFTIGGHTDADGDEAYNLRLSERRARAVLAYLTRSHGVDASRLLVRAYGETRPLDRSSTPEAYALNRRVDFEISPDSVVP